MLDETQGYAVFFYPQALEALGEAIRPYMLDGPSGPHVLCKSIDTGGALIEMTIEGRSAEGNAMAVELMVPSNMVRMIVSARSDGVFGFGPRVAATHVDSVAVPPTALASAQPLHAPLEIPKTTVDPVTPVMAKLPPKV
ncbi:MAG TPA: hypothetical protein VIT90_18820 [Lysobacter sp.]